VDDRSTIGPIEPKAERSRVRGARHGGADAGARYGVLAAHGTLIILPIIVFPLIVNRYIVSGLTQGAVKG
jgi:ABC-type glycerol-3-phosphate transport system permease component